MKNHRYLIYSLMIMLIVLLSFINRKKWFGNEPENVPLEQILQYDFPEKLKEFGNFYSIWKPDAKTDGVIEEVEASYGTLWAQITLLEDDLATLEYFQFFEKAAIPLILAGVDGRDWEYTLDYDIEFGEYGFVYSDIATGANPLDRIRPLNTISFVEIEEVRLIEHYIIFARCNTVVMVSGSEKIPADESVLETPIVLDYAQSIEEGIKEQICQ